MCLPFLIIVHLKLLDYLAKILHKEKLALTKTVYVIPLNKLSVYEKYSFISPYVTVV